MKFAKDILLIDFEGFDSPSQIGAVLLDKETLEEKDSFVSFIWKDMKGKVSMKSGITQEMLEGAPSQAEVAKIFFAKFGTDVFLGGFCSQLDTRHLKTIMESAEIDYFQYDWHILDLWPVSYIHLLKNGYTGGFRSEDIFQKFGAEPRGNHNALEDCRLVADVLRKIFLN